MIETVNRNICGILHCVTCRLLTIPSHKYKIQRYPRPLKIWFIHCYDQSDRLQSEQSQDRSQHCLLWAEQCGYFYFDCFLQVFGAGQSAVTHLISQYYSQYHGETKCVEYPRYLHTTQHTAQHAGLFYLSVAECDLVIFRVASQQCNMLRLQQGPGHNYWGLSGVWADPVLSGAGVVLQTVERTGGQSHR